MYRLLSYIQTNYQIIFYWSTATITILLYSHVITFSIHKKNDDIYKCVGSCFRHYIIKISRRLVLPLTGRLGYVVVHYYRAHYFYFSLDLYVILLLYCSSPSKGSYFIKVLDPFFCIIFLYASWQHLHCTDYEKYMKKLLNLLAPVQNLNWSRFCNVVKNELFIWTLKIKFSNAFLLPGMRKYMKTLQWFQEANKTHRPPTSKRSNSLTGINIKTSKFVNVLTRRPCVLCYSMPPDFHLCRKSNNYVNYTTEYTYTHT